jgi:hypothetical protein
MCLTVLAILAGTLTLAWKTTAELWNTPEREAQSLAAWMSGLVTRSNRSGRPFEIVCSGSVTRNIIEAFWQNPIEKETYRSLRGCDFIRYQSVSVRSLYTPQWNALVPTITVKVSRRRQKESFVIVSQHGRVRISSVPPAK